MAARGGRQRRRRRAWERGWQPWARVGLEGAALLVSALIVVLAVLGRVAGALEGAGFWSHLLPFAGAVLILGMTVAFLLRGWLRLRTTLVRHHVHLPVALGGVACGVALWFAAGIGFQRDLGSLRTLVGGRAESQRLTIAHQVYAAYRRADLDGLARVFERARVYEPTVYEAAHAFGMDAEVLMGVGVTESAFYPRDSADGGRGLFQITVPPAPAVTDVRRKLGVERLDALNQRHNAFLAAATLRRYLADMRGDPFLGLLAYNIGPKNGGLLAIMEQYGARDFVTIQPYLHTLPRDYPIRVLSAALAYRLWRIDGRLPRYEDGNNAVHVQRVGIPGLAVGKS